jgi:hypothetical protein
MPEFIPDMAQQIDLDILSNFILRLSQAGVQMFPDEDLEDYVRDAAGLPDAQEGRPWTAQLEEQAGDEKKQPAKSPAKAIVKAIMGEQLKTGRRRLCGAWRHRGLRGQSRKKSCPRLSLWRPGKMDDARTSLCQVLVCKESKRSYSFHRGARGLRGYQSDPQNRLGQ